MDCIYTALWKSGHSKRLIRLASIDPFMHTFTHRRPSQPRSATASSSGADVLLRDTSALNQEEPWIEPATIWFPVNPLYLLSHMTLLYFFVKKWLEASVPQCDQTLEIYPRGQVPWEDTFTFTFRVFSRPFSPKRLTMSSFVRRKRNNISLSVQWYDGCS